jgi:hypothetical protein
MNRVTLPNGYADLRDPADVRERQRRPLKRIQAQLAARPAFAQAVTAAQRQGKGKALSADAQLKIAAGMGDAFDLLEDLNDYLVVALVAGWSYGDDVSLEAVQDIPGRDLDALREACAPFLAAIMPDFEATPEADSPIAPSVD